MATIIPRKRKGGGISWTARIRLARDGVVYHDESKTFSDKHYKLKEVERWVADRERAIERDEVEVASGKTFADGIAMYLRDFTGDGGWGRSKITSLNALKSEPIAGRPWESLRASDWIEHVMMRRNSGAGPSTVANDLIWARVVHKVARPAWNIDVDTLMIDAAAEVCRAQRLIGRSQQRTRRPTLAELDLILDYTASRDGRASIPLSDFVLFALFSARRQDEICRIVRADYTPAAGDGWASVIVRDMKDPKRKKGNDVRVFLPPEAVAILDRQPTVVGDDRFFPFKGKSVSGAFARTCKMVAVNDLRFHDVRHEATSRLFELGYEIPRVAQVTGHRSWQNLQRYTHLYDSGVTDKYAGWRWLPSLAG